MTTHHLFHQLRILLPRTIPGLCQSSGLVTRRCSPAATLVSRNHFLDARDKDHEEKSKTLVISHQQLFDELAAKEKSKRTFVKALSIYLKRHGVQRRGHVEFIYASLNQMKEFGVEKDIDVYKEIIGLFPKGKMQAMSVWQSELMHYPKQQQCLIDILEKMEINGLWYFIIFCGKCSV